MDSNSSNNFQIEILKQIAKEKKDTNLLISPISIFLALALTAHGAKGKTLEEMLKVINSGKSIEDLDKYTKEVLSVLEKSKSIQVANAVLTKVKPTDTFTDSCKSFNALIDKLVSVEQVNGWCKEKTNGKIPTILDSISDIEMCILNAVYFLGKWETAFNPKEIHELAFVKDSGEEQKVPMMSALFNDAQYYEDEKMQLMLLPYTEIGVTGVLMLPDRKIKIDDFIAELKNDYLIHALQYTETRKVSLTVPKFKIESEMKCKDVLMNLGMTTPFGDTADFSDITKETALKISDVTHKTFIDVNEEGTEAAAVTKVGMFRMMMPNPKDIPVRFLCNRPFLFSVCNFDMKDMFLFMAKIATLK